MNVLVVDDDSIDAESIQRLLEYSDPDAHVDVAKTVDDGVKQYQNNNFDVILLDYRMPGRDGIELVMLLRSEMKDWSAAIIMMSTSDDDELAVRCLKAGAQDFLPKSEITIGRLHRAIINAQTRNKLEAQLRESYTQVKKMAESDSLTGLANRHVFEESLQFAIVASKRNPENKIGLLTLNVDNFKFINDTYGHAVGDHVLQNIVQRVKGCLRGGELFARLGGDEFAIIVNNLSSSLQAGQIASRIRKVMLSPFHFEECQFTLSVSIGIALYPDNGGGSQEITQHADVALYRAKKLGRNRICFYQQEMQASFTDRFVLEQALRQAVDQNQLLLQYQPCYKSESYEIECIEALVRWNHPGRGLLYPDQFIKIAEDSRQILHIGRWIMEKAIEQLSRWNATHNRNVKIAINLSPIQLVDRCLISTIESACKKYSVSPSLIIFELTETAFFEETELLVSCLNHIVDMGCQLALDDFGTGFSSVSHLRNFPISTVKIDKSLMPVDGLTEKDRSLVNALVLMVHSLGLSTVIEGLETQEHVDFCKSLNVNFVQGFYFSEPVDPVKIDHYLSTGIPEKTH